MNRFNTNKNRQNIFVILIILVGLIALSNQRISITDPENTYPKRIKRAFRLWLNPPQNDLEKHLIGKGIRCADGENLYKKAAAATVVIKADESLGAGVLIGPRLVATAAHVVEGRNVEVFLPEVNEESLARPGRSIKIRSIYPVQGLDLAFISLQDTQDFWLDLEQSFKGDTRLMIVGHPNGKYYSLQKARIKKKDLLESSSYVVFKDNEIFFGNSGGAIVDCDGQLVGVVSMMANFQNSHLKQGIGINSRTIAKFASRMKLRLN
ncbi:MAG: serine protease [Nitrospinales bacterium]